MCVCAPVCECVSGSMRVCLCVLAPLSAHQNTDPDEFIELSMCLCVCVSLCLCVSVSLCLCVSVSLCLCVSVSVSVSVSVPVSVSVSVSMSVRKCV